MFDPILVPHDGSVLASRAFPYALTLAARLRSRLILMQAVHMSGLPDAEAQLYNEEVTEEPRQRLSALADEALRAGVPGVWDIVDGEPGPAIVSAAEHADAQLIVMASHARGDLGRLTFGSVADWVIRHVSIPVLVIPAHVRIAWNEETEFRIVLPLDGSAISEEILGPAGEIAGALGAQVILVRAVEAAESVPRSRTRRHVDALWDYLAAASKRVDGDAVEVWSDVRVGKAADVILGAVTAFDANVIAMSTHGRSGVPRLFLGSESAAVLHRSPVPVLLMRSAVARSAEATSSMLRRPGVRPDRAG
ncbi:MAG TPA: universal stress protein [Chloroflexota bacterium]|nr:universal stress protein [Chloroflexota bacterium]